MVLFAHGARDPAWSAPLLRLRDTAAAREPSVVVSVAYLEFMSLDLPCALDSGVAAGADKVRVVPVLLA